MRLKNMPARDTSSNNRRPFLWYPSMYLCAGIVNRKFASPKPVITQKSVGRRLLLFQGCESTVPKFSQFTLVVFFGIAFPFLMSLKMTDE